MPKGLAILAAVAALLVLVVVLFSYLALPALIEDRLAANVQQRYGLQNEPEVEVFSGFPPELLLGRIDRVKVHIDQMSRRGIELRNVLAELQDVEVSVVGLIRGERERDIRTASLKAEVPEESINEYLQQRDLGLEGWEVEVGEQELEYRGEEPIFGLPASVSFDVRVTGPRTVEVVPNQVELAELDLPSSVIEPLVSRNPALQLAELPFGVELRSVKPLEGALIVHAARE